MNPRFRLVVIALLLLCGRVEAGSHVTVTADKVYTGVTATEFFPRFATYLPGSIQVAVGEDVRLFSGTYAAIEVAGRLYCDPGTSMLVNVTHLTILPGGIFDCQVADGVTVEILIRNVPIDTTRDPFQFGNGIINLGTKILKGPWVTPFVHLTAAAQAGSTQLPVDAPADWQLGDELLVTDSHQPTSTNPLRRESRVFIAGFSPGAVWLSKPLDFSHLPMTDPSGAVVAYPVVANLRRNLIIESENPTGTRGHVIDIGHESSWDEQGVLFADLGRTQNVKLDSTTVDATGNVTHLGLNQVGRYGGAHKHHAGHGTFRDNVLLSNGIAKWGVAIHGTHDIEVADTIAVGFLGAAFVTEDGYETRVAFRRNLAAYIPGNGRTSPENFSPFKAGVSSNCPGCEGAGFWLHSVRVTLDGNEAWNSMMGFNLFAQDPVLGKFPSTPGGEPDTPMTLALAEPVSFGTNLGAANRSSGWEHWGTQAFDVPGVSAVYNGTFQFRVGRSDTSLVDITAVCSGARAVGVESTAGYTGTLLVTGGRVVGCEKGFIGGGAIVRFELRDLTLQNKTNVAFFTETPPITPTPMVFERLHHVQLGAFPKQYIYWGPGTIWQPGKPQRYSTSRAHFPALGTRAVILDWQGTGQDYRLYDRQQLRENPAPPADGALDHTNLCPVAGITVGECWDRFGLAWGAGVVAGAATQTLEGVVNGLVEPGIVTPLGPPRWAITSPNMQSPARIEIVNGAARVRAQGWITGMQTNAQLTSGYVSVDGAPAVRVNKVQGQYLDELSFFLTGSQIAPGMHTIRTWRLAPNNALIAESELSFSFYVN